MTLNQFKGIIAAGAADTVAAGAEILEMGGNAIDAAVAATFASYVSEIVLVNICGGGIATVHLAESDRNIVYDFFGDMPSGVYDPQQADFKEIIIDFGVTQQSFFIGRASVAVPGVVAGLCTLAAEHGTLPLSILLKPAIRLAQEGIVLSKEFGYMSQILVDIFMDTPESAAIHAPNGQIAGAGERLYNPQLAQTLFQLGQFGKDYFYKGAIAEKIIADQEQNGGLITQTDLANYQVYQLDPITIPYKGYTILAPPPSSVGGY